MIVSWLILAAAWVIFLGAEFFWWGMYAMTGLLGLLTAVYCVLWCWLQIEKRAWRRESQR